MEDLIREAGPAEVRGPLRSWRAVSIFAALALIVGGVVLARGAEPTHKTNAVTSVVGDHGHAVFDGAGAVLGKTLGFGAAVPQINVSALIRSIVCPILFALAAGPFGAFIGPIIASLEAAFGCASL